jgi:hypothetical protein
MAKKLMYMYTHHVLCRRHAGQLRELLRERGLSMREVVQQVYVAKLSSGARCWCCLREVDANVFLEDNKKQHGGNCIKQWERVVSYG